MSTLTLRLEAYDKAAKTAIAAAQTLGDERKNPEVLPLHLLYTLLDRDAISSAAVEKAGVDPMDVMVEAELMIRKLASIEDVPTFLSPRLLELLGRAEGEAARNGGVPVTSADLMLACAQENGGAVKKVFRATGLSAPILRATLDGIMQKAARSPSAGGSTSSSRSGAKRDEGDPLEEFGRDLTRQAAHGGFDPTVGRDAELRRILQVLARRRENNPLLVGEPGIGKTAIVNGFAGRLARGDVPRFLEGRRVVGLEMGALVAGAKLRGQLEERLRSLLAALRDSGGEVILFLSDLPSLTGRGGAAGLLANALARGEVRAIAVATPDELRKVMDEEPLLARRFVSIPVDPPTLDEALAVLRGVVGRFEIDHGVRISDPALNSAVQFGRRYVPGVQLPKSAIDLIDEAAARVRVEMESVPAELDAMERKLEALRIQEQSLDDDLDEASQRSREKLADEAEKLTPRIAEMRERWEAELGIVGEVKRLKGELGAAQRELEQVRAADDHARAGELRFGSIPLLEKQLVEAEEKLGAHGDTMVHDTVMPEDVADVVAAWTGVPVARMLEEETQKLLRMEDSLRERVIGQDAAVTALSKAVRRGRVGLRDPRRPIGSFLFLGPTGVGKTELAKTLAEFLFDDEASLTRIDMSEFMEKHSVARLLGSPPGYVDSDQGGFLTEAVRQRPYSVVLFDEMEKAHPDVFNILLQVLDDGRLTDSRGRLAHFQDTVVLMTSNVGSELILDHEGTNEELKEKMRAALHDHFRPEFLNRIDDVVIFDPLDKQDLKGIAAIQLRALAKLLGHRRVGLEVTDAAVDHIVDLGYQPAFGARPLKRVILRELQDPLADALLRGGYGPGEKVLVDVKGDKLTFTKAG
ncbi:MAG: AAA domain-containing protein [Deltaproteobacteria bacterium]|nr:AAA domain-containing protein [Deltaproteobacteria bacterium]